MKHTPQYFAYKNNIEGALRNGSFVRTTRTGQFALWMNGDFMGCSDSVDLDRYAEVDRAKAQKLIPDCCK